jgi:hypothetical protein
MQFELQSDYKLDTLVLEMTQAQAHHNFMLHLCTTHEMENTTQIRKT